MLQTRGFEVRSLTPDRNSLSVVASAVVLVSILIGITSGAYNAVFLRAGSAVLELCPFYLPGGTRPWQVGFAWLGVHQYTYTCPHLYTSDMREVFSDWTTDAATLGMQSPIAISPRTIITILDELFEVLVQARESGSEEGGLTVRLCLPWERNHSLLWTRHALLGGALPSST